MFRRLKTYQLIVDLLVAGLFALAALPVEIGFGRSTDHNALWSVVVALLFTAALGMRRLSPGGALGLAWAGSISQMALGRPPSPTDLAILAVLYATAAYGGRVVFWTGLASTVIGAAVITVYLFAQPILVSGADLSTITTAAAVLVASLFGLGLAWTIGALVRTGVRARVTRDAQRRAEAEAVIEQERVRIARDMHDVVAHSLAVVIAQADGARYALAAAAAGRGAKDLSEPSAAGAALGTISSTARAALADVRLLLTQLRHGQSDGPQPTLADLEELYAHVRVAGVELRIDVDPAPPDTPPAAVQLAVYRILQEALTNALRHGAAPVDVRLAWLPQRVDVVVQNPLLTGEPARAIGGSGHGLIGMGERAQLAGGRLEAGAEGGSFAVRASIPIGGAP